MSGSPDETAIIKNILVEELCGSFISAVKQYFVLDFVEFYFLWVSGNLDLLKSIYIFPHGNEWNLKKRGTALANEYSMVLIGRKRLTEVDRTS